MGVTKRYPLSLFFLLLLWQQDFFTSLLRLFPRMGVHGMDSLAFAPAAFSEGVVKRDTLADQIAS